MPDRGHSRGDINVHRHNPGLSREVAGAKHYFEGKVCVASFVTISKIGSVLRLNQVLYQIQSKVDAHNAALPTALARHAGKVVTHREIFKEVCGPASARENIYLRVYIKQLRNKLESDSAHVRYVLSDPGFGYRLAIVSN